MALKYKIGELTEVAEAVRSFYVRDANGGYVLDAEGVVPKDRLDEFRNNNIELNKRLEALKDVDPKKYAELLELDRKVQEKQLIEAGKLDEALELRTKTMRETFGTEKAALEAELNSTRSTLSVLMIDNVVKSAAVQNGVLPTALDDILLRARSSFTVEKGQAVLKGADGNIVYGKDGSTPMTVNEWVTGLRKSAPHLFTGFKGTGAGGGTNSGGHDTSKLSPAQKIGLGMSTSGLLGSLPGA